MNVLFDHQIFGRQQYGGISRYYFELMRELSRGFPDVDVDLFMGLHINAYDFQSLKRVKKRGLRRPRVRFTGRAFAKVNDYLMQAHAWGQRADIHHSTYFQPTNLGARMRVLTVYDMIQERFPDMFASGDETSKHKARAIAEADAIIAISEHTREDIIEILGTAPEKIRTIHLGNSLRIAAGDSPVVEEPYLLYVGERHEYKNFPLLLREYAGAGDINREYKLVAFGGPDWSPAEKQVMNAAGISGRVTRLSGGDELLANLYKHAELFVYPSLYEGFGIPPLEAMYHGCPIVAGRGGSIPEVVGEAALYFDEDLTGALRRLLSDGRLRTELIAAGREREKQFSWEECASRTHSFYKELLAG